MAAKQRSRRLSGLSLTGKIIAIVVLLYLNVLAGFAELKAENNSPTIQRVEQVRPWLGVAIEAGPKGVLIKDIIPDTPAAKAGFKKGDEITAIDAAKVAKPEDLIAQVQAQGIGNTVTVHYLRQGKAATQKVKLVARPDELEMLKQQLVDKPAPDFALKALAQAATPEKIPARLKDLKNQVVILEFWATWCPACRSTHERLSKYAQKNAGKNIKVLAVSNEDQKTIEAYAKQLKPAFVVLQDEGEEAHKAYRVSAIPLLIVIDKTGIVRFATMGAGDYLEEALRAADKLAAAS